MYDQKQGYIRVYIIFQYRYGTCNWYGRYLHSEIGKGPLALQTTQNRATAIITGQYIEARTDASTFKNPMPIKKTEITHLIKLV